MQQKGEKFPDSATDNTDYSYTLDKHEPPFINKIIESTEEIINNQAIKIFELSNQLKQLRSENEVLRGKYDLLLRLAEEGSRLELDGLVRKVRDLETELVEAKMSLAMLKAENLEIKFAGMKMSKHPQLQVNEVINFPEIDKLRNNLKSQIEKADNQVNSSQWLKLVELYLTGYPQLAKFKQKTADLARKGIPVELRQKLWPLIFDNRLGITSSLYSLLLGRKKLDESYTKKVLSQINKDICRSFNGKTQFDEKVGLALEVTEILEVFHIYRPDVSYVQGMTYPAIVLSLIVGKHKAFEIFCNLIIGNDFFRRLYAFEQNYLNCYCRGFDLLLEQKLPKTAKLLSDRGIQSEIYLVEWFYTFYSRGLSYEYTLKVWDCLAYEGELLFFKLGLAIFELLEPTLLGSQLEDTIAIIKQYSDHITEAKLYQVLLGQKLTHEKMDRALQRGFRKYEAVAE